MQMQIAKKRYKFQKYLNINVLDSCLTHFMPLISFDTPLKHQKTLMFSGGIKRDQWHEMG